MWGICRCFSIFVTSTLTQQTRRRHALFGAYISIDATDTSHHQLFEEHALAGGDLNGNMHLIALAEHGAGEPDYPRQAKGTT